MVSCRRMSRWDDSMIRLQIQLTEAQRDALREVAHRQQRSVAAVVRDSIDLYLRQERDGRGRRMTEALAYAGRHRSGRTDVSVRHDEYLAEANSSDDG
jgi:hypothetical protein